MIWKCYSCKPDCVFSCALKTDHRAAEELLAPVSKAMIAEETSGRGMGHSPRDVVRLGRDIELWTRDSAKITECGRMARGEKRTRLGRWEADVLGQMGC